MRQPTPVAATFSFYNWTDPRRCGVSRENPPPTDRPSRRPYLTLTRKVSVKLGAGDPPWPNTPTVVILTPVTLAS